MSGGLSGKSHEVPDEFRAWPVKRLLPLSGGEAQCYLINYEGREAILRLYRQDSEPKMEVFQQKFGLFGIDAIETGHDEETGLWFAVCRPYCCLTQRLQERGLSEAEFTTLVFRMTSALGILHSGNRFHSHTDLRPGIILIKFQEDAPLNFLTSGLGQVSLLEDTYLALDFSGDPADGPPLYSAPEALAHPDALGQETEDWWSLGAILLEIKLGRHPLAGLNSWEIAAEILSRGLAVPEGLPPDTAMLLKGLLTRDPKKRWRGEDVRKWLAGERDMPVHYETALLM